MGFPTKTPFLLDPRANAVTVTPPVEDPIAPQKRLILAYLRQRKIPSALRVFRSLRPSIDLRLREKSPPLPYADTDLLSRIMVAYIAQGMDSQAREILSFLLPQGYVKPFTWTRMAEAYHGSPEVVERKIASLAKYMSEPVRGRSSPPDAIFFAIWLRRSGEVGPKPFFRVWATMQDRAIAPTKTHVNILLQYALPWHLSSTPLPSGIDPAFLRCLAAWEATLRKGASLTDALATMHEVFGLAPDPHTWSILTRFLAPVNAGATHRMLRKATRLATQSSGLSLPFPPPGSRAFTLLLQQFLRDHLVERAISVLHEHLSPGVSPGITPKACVYPWSMLLNALADRNDLGPVMHMWTTALRLQIPLDKYALAAVVRALCRFSRPWEAEEIAHAWADRTGLSIDQNIRDLLILGYARARDPGSLSRHLRPSGPLASSVMSTPATVAALRTLGPYGDPEPLLQHNLPLLLPPSAIEAHRPRILLESARRLSAGGQLAYALHLAENSSGALLLARIEHGMSPRRILIAWEAYLAPYLHHATPAETWEEVRMVRLGVLRRLARLATPKEIRAILQAHPAPPVLPTVKEYSAYILALSRAGLLGQAREELTAGLMAAAGISPNRWSWHALADALAFRGDVPGCSQLLEEMASSGIPLDGVSWNILIKAYMHRSLPEDPHEVARLRHLKAQAGWGDPEGPFSHRSYLPVSLSPSRP